MKELFEVIGEFLIEWTIYKISDVFYGTKKRPASMVRIAFARAIYICVLMAAISGLAFAADLNLPRVIEHVFNQTAAVILIIFASLLWPLVVMLGEYRAGNVVVAYSVVGISLLLAVAGIMMMISLA